MWIEINARALRFNYERFRKFARGARIGDEVVLIGQQGSQSISAHDMAGKIGTTAYEVLTRVNPLIKRILK